VQILDPRLLLILRHPAAFGLRALRNFHRNQGLLLAGAVAYYALLSIVPMLILIVIALSHVITESELLQTLGRYLDWLLPGQAPALVNELAHFLNHRQVIGWTLLLTMLFSSSLAFTVLESAMSIIFLHRVVVRRRRWLISALIPYVYILCLGLGLLLATLVSGGLQAMGEDDIELLGRDWSLGRPATALLYLLGLAGEVAVLTSIYMVMPVGRLSLKHALFGAVIAVCLWELSRRLLVWYFSTLAQIGLVYGSLTTAIAVLLSLELAATLLLLGAQLIAEFERLPGQPRAQ
jgi:YihY family inner membrane protein